MEFLELVAFGVLDVLEDVAAVLLASRGSSCREMVSKLWRGRPRSSHSSSSTVEDDAAAILGNEASVMGRYYRDDLYILF